MDDGEEITLLSFLSRSKCGGLVSIFCFPLFESWWRYTGDGGAGLEVYMCSGWYTGESEEGVGFSGTYIVGGILLWCEGIRVGK
jgi:hypothetical protein